MKLKKLKIIEYIKIVFFRICGLTWPIVIPSIIFVIGFIFMPRESWITLSASPYNVEIKDFSGEIVSTFRTASINQGFLQNREELSIIIDNSLHHVAPGQLVIFFTDLGTHWNSIIIEGQNQAMLYIAGNQHLSNACISIRNFNRLQPWLINDYSIDNTSLDISFTSQEISEMMFRLPIGENIQIQGGFNILINNTPIQTSTFSRIEIMESGIIPNATDSTFSLRASEFSINMRLRHGDIFILNGNIASFYGRFGNNGNLRHTYVGIQNEYDVSNMPVSAAKLNYLLSVSGEFRQELSQLSISGLVSEVIVAESSLHFNVRQFAFLNFNVLFLGVVAAILAKIIPKYSQKENA